MPNFKIVSRWDEGKVLYEGDAETLRDLVGTAVRARANLADANLAGADLAGSYLAGADLACANLAGADLAGSYLAGAYLADAYLADANLADANLADANLAGADLAGSYLACANLAGADLACANLADANLADANLAGAYLADAYLADAHGEKLTLVGPRPYFEVGPIGSRSDRLVAWMTDAGVWVHAGCWRGTLDAFRERVASVYPEGKHGEEYRAAIAMVETHARVWAGEEGR